MRTNIFLVSTIMVILGFSINAQPPGRDMEKEKAIWEKLEAVTPTSLETFKSATIALDENEYKKAISLYRQVLENAPGFDPVYRRLGTALVENGETEEGMAYLEKAVSLNPSPENRITLANYLAYPGNSKEGTIQNKERALSLAKQARDSFQGNADPEYIYTVAQLSLLLEKEQDFRQAVAELESRFQGQMPTHYFLAIRSAMDGNRDEAEKEIRIAQSMGMPAENTDEFIASLDNSNSTAWRYTYYVLYLAIAWLAGIIALFIIGKILSIITIRSITTDDPNAAATPQVGALRGVYRTLINIAGIYYYVSIPVVIILIIFLVGSIIYGFLMFGHIPIKLLAIIVIAGVMTIYIMIRSVFIKVEADDPGRSLQSDEAAGLWRLTREVADTIGTRPIDEIRITPGTELAVYEKGTFKERAQDRAQRILILGVATLSGFKQNDFRAVLAHEYGHFSHRDTAGGDVALRVNGDMMKFAIAMAVSGQAVWWNIAFLFLRVYHFIFRRISHGATRLQEVLADRLAAGTYGAAAFEGGLRHVIRRGVEFGRLLEKELIISGNAVRHFHNAYRVAEFSDIDEKTRIEDEISAEINRPTSEDDTHPSPSERFQLVRKINSSFKSESTGLMWELFSNPEGLITEMSDLLNAQVKTNEEADLFSSYS